MYFPFKLKKFPIHAKWPNLAILAVCVWMRYLFVIGVMAIMSDNVGVTLVAYDTLVTYETLVAYETALFMQNGQIWSFGQFVLRRDISL